MCTADLELCTCCVPEGAAAEQVRYPTCPQTSLSRFNYVTVCAGLPSGWSRSLELHEHILAALVSIDRVAVLMQVSSCPEDTGKSLTQLQYLVFKECTLLTSRLEGPRCTCQGPAKEAGLLCTKHMMMRCK